MKTTVHFSKSMMNDRMKKSLYADVLNVFRKVFEEMGHPFSKKQGS